MRIFSDIGSKFVWFIIVVLAVGFGYVFVLRNFLNPPPATLAPVSTSSSPVQTLAPAQSPNSVATSSGTGEPSPILVPNSGNSSTVDNPNSLSTGADSSPMPALALPEQVALKVPQKLEKGGILKIYLNNDKSAKPDPIKYSPSKILKTPGLFLINIDRNQFEEVSGYFLIEKTGSYNFVITQPDSRRIRLEHLRAKINGITLPTTTGGSVALDKGWHHVSVFLKGSKIDANVVRVSYGIEGETLKRLDVWREVEAK